MPERRKEQPQRVAAFSIPDQQGKLPWAEALQLVLRPPRASASCTNPDNCTVRSPSRQAVLTRPRKPSRWFRPENRARSAVLSPAQTTALYHCAGAK